MKFIKNGKWLALMLVGILVLSAILTGCGSSNAATTSPSTTQGNSTSTTSTNSTTTPASTLSGNITETGSTTVQPLAEKLAGAFMTDNPKVKVTIQGGGTAVGIKAVNDGTVDIGASSRELTSADPTLQTYLLARDGIAIVVNPTNTVTNLTTDQIRDIFSGKITNWNQVGGQDGEIHVVAREEGSGTRTGFQDMVMGKDAAGNSVDIVKNAILQNSNGGLMQVVKSDTQSAGFLSFGYLNSSVKALSVNQVAATEANAKDGTYPIVRPLYFLTKSQPTGVVKAFLDYCTGPGAQEIVSNEGYISVN